MTDEHTDRNDWGQRLVDADLPEDDGTFRTEPIPSGCRSAKQLFPDED